MQMKTFLIIASGLFGLGCLFTKHAKKIQENSIVADNKSSNELKYNAPKVDPIQPYKFYESTGCFYMPKWKKLKYYQPTKKNPNRGA